MPLLIVIRVVTLFVWKYRWVVKSVAGAEPYMLSPVLKFRLRCEAPYNGGRSHAWSSSEAQRNPP
jgi:hypothetical protein